MPEILLAAAAQPVVALADAKAFMRIDHEADDALVAALVETATLTVEAASGRLLAAQGWRIVLDAWPSGGVMTPRARPLVEVTAARILAADGTPLVIDAQDFAVEPGGMAIRFTPQPAPGRATAGIEIDVTAGHADPAGIPPPLVHAVRLLAADWYERRGAVPDGAPPVPAQVAALVAPFRRMRV